MGLVGKGGAFVGGTGALAFLLAAEVVAATAAVSEAALVYVARHRNLMISCLMIAVQAALTVGIILAMRSLPLDRGQLPGLQAAGAAVGAGAGARHGLDPQGAAAGAAARRAGAGLALVAGLGGAAAASAGRLRRDLAARMGRASVGAPADPGHLRAGDLVSRLHRRRPEAVPLRPEGEAGAPRLGARHAP